MARSDRGPEPDQSLLFGDTPRERALGVVPPMQGLERFCALAERLPSSLRLGTSSWTFAGWRGHLYGPRAATASLPRYGLAAYSSHPLLRTVGLDRAFYSPLSRHDASDLAGLVPGGFRFLVKAHQSITRPRMDSSGSTFGDTGSLRAAGQPNPRYLDAAYVAESLLPPLLNGMGAALGPIVFQFPPLDLESRDGDGTQAAWIERLDRFLEALPVGPLYVVEVRNRTLARGAAGEQLVSVLRDRAVSWGFAVHPTMPSVDEQLQLVERAGWPVERQPCLSIRWLLGHGLGYEEARSRYEPFDRLVAPDELAREAIVRASLRAIAASVPGWIIINNKAEGSAFLSVERLAESIAASRAGRPAS